jgi:hypothetical protein
VVYDDLVKGQWNATFISIGTNGNCHSRDGLVVMLGNQKETMRT